MWPQFLRGYANTLIASYAVDALVSLLHVATQSSALAGIRGLLATYVVFLSAMALPLLGLTRRLPLRVFVPIIASTLWFASGAVPFAFKMESAALESRLVFGQLLIAGYAFLRIRRLRAGEGWLFDASWFSGRLFSLPYFVGYQVAATLTLVVFAAGLLVFGLANGLESATNGFVRFDAQGVSFADRRYENDGQWIRLVGMMHIGEEAGYRTLFRDLDRGSASTLVLTEGVSDSQGALLDGLSYAPLADFLGVEEQRAIEDYVEWTAGESASGHASPVFMNADVDVSSFDPRTIEWLGKVTSIYSGTDAFSGLVEIYESMQRDPETAAVILDDIVTRRNEILIAHIVDFRTDYEEIVVPWGALHLSGIEVAVLEMGFVRRSAAYVPLISWSRLGDALFGDPTASHATDSGDAAERNRKGIGSET